jgi:hypothetical protein
LALPRMTGEGTPPQSQSDAWGVVSGRLLSSVVVEAARVPREPGQRRFRELLTACAVEVLEVLAQGASNRRIADRIDDWRANGWERR